jgi:hypothetical protein
MTGDPDRKRALAFLSDLPKAGILAWFEQSSIGQTALKALGAQLAKRNER